MDGSTGILFWDGCVHTGINARNCIVFFEKRILILGKSKLKCKKQ